MALSEKSPQQSPLLAVDGLSVHFKTEWGDWPFVSDLSFQLHEGEVLGLVGESGSGKTVSMLAILQLLESNGRIASGSIQLQGEELVGKTPDEMDRIRGSKISLIFQDALSSLNPVLTIGNQLTEGLRLHLKLSRKDAWQRAAELLRHVGIAETEKWLRAYPHELSGGMRQRVMIAMALSCDPLLLIADEPTTALDVTIQAQIMELLKRLRREDQMSMILITHDIGLVAEMADRVIVMYAGQVVEATDIFTLFKAPSHPYTQLLLASVPSIQDDPEQPLVAIHGYVPEHYEMLQGCRFANRCPYALEGCLHHDQELSPIDAVTSVRCERAERGEIPRLGREEVRQLVRAE